MVRCERFTIEYSVANTKVLGEYCIESELKSEIYDRVQKKNVVTIDTGDEELNDELAQQVLTMLNIKFIGK